MNLVWKLLRQHISPAQMLGFFFANLFGMTIILLAYQFYNDVMPVFTSPDSFMKAEYKIVSKKVNTGNTLSGRSTEFYQSDIDELKNNSIVKSVAEFTCAQYRVIASIGINGSKLLSTEIYFESVPDEYVDIPLDKWKWDESSIEVPIILPRSYINMYNFGFAQARSLPKISDGLIGMIDVDLTVIGNSKTESLKGRVVGFSNRLTTILVPQSFMDWSNSRYSDGNESMPSRLIVESVQNKEQEINELLEDKGMEIESGNPNSEKTASFLRLMIGLVVGVGLLISVLSFYILMLSIYLLVQKNAIKMQNLLLIGYSPSQVARPYQLLTIALLIVVFLISVLLVIVARNYYLGMIELLYPQLASVSLVPMICLGIILVFIVSCFNIIIIYNKVLKCQHPVIE